MAFGNAAFYISINDSEPQNPYREYEQLAQRKFPQKIYSYYSITNTRQSKQLQDEIKDYLNNTTAQENIPIPSDWCVYCPQKGVCVEPFLQQG